MEYIAIIVLILCILLIIIEYLWLYVLAEKQERYNKNRKADLQKIASLTEAVLMSPTDQGKLVEIENLGTFVHNHADRMDDLTDLLFKLLITAEPDSSEQITTIAILNQLAPMEFYKTFLQNGNVYEKTKACKKAAMFFSEEQIPQIREYLYSKNKELSYMAAMALSRLGDEETLAQFIISCENNYEYSHRLIIEFLENYSGDLQKLCELIFRDCGDYIKAAVIKGIAKYRFFIFEPIYAENLYNKNQELAAACIRALGELADPKYEHELIVASNHKNWIIRSAAVKALANYSSDEVLEAVKKTTQDPEWWVRYNSANTLVKIDKSFLLAEKVLGGYDRYASDAVKYALYRNYMEEQGVSTV